jgi:hypothetical protein
MKKSRSGDLKGLCKTCLKAGTCTLPRASESLVLECETYEASKPIRIPRFDLSGRQDRPTGGGENRGLCTDCDLRDTCTFAKPESGVWRCEYYR